mmetsp:Transcript_67285/g.186422  ORF Transcript_67285/g.186422 Transcript_67285/m.186422 type:complete len:216 (+) Transcript_67285:784-1431(+)
MHCSKMTHKEQARKHLEIALATEWSMARAPLPPVSRSPNPSRGSDTSGGRLPGDRDASFRAFLSPRPPKTKAKSKLTPPRSSRPVRHPCMPRTRFSETVVDTFMLIADPNNWATLYMLKQKPRLAGCVCLATKHWVMDRLLQRKVVHQKRNRIKRLALLMKARPMVPQPHPRAVRNRQASSLSMPLSTTVAQQGAKTMVLAQSALFMNCICPIVK